MSIPPLRKRTEDILPFMYDYFNRYLNRYGSTIKDIEEEVVQVFLKQSNGRVI